MYIAEIAPARIRGRLVTLNQMAIVTGILVAYFVAWLLVDTGDNNWRWMFASESLPALLLLVGLLLVPESPRWLAKRGELDQALAVLTRVGGQARATYELEEITLALSREEGTLAELLRPGLRVALMIGVVLAILGQISGINTIIYYAPKIFLKAGFEEARSAMWATVLVGTTNCVVTIVSLCVIDKIGRKPLLLLGTAGMGIAMTLAGLYLADDSVSTAAKVCIILAYIASFGVGVGGVVWVVIAEIFPTKIRGRAVSIATASVWVACFAVAQTFPYLLGRFSDRVFWIYAVLCGVMFLFVLLVVTETKGKSLEEIEQMWRRAGETGEYVT
jgi:sugar porter (SP) family MFS transporter